MDNITSDIVVKALDMSLAQQKVIAQNIANVSTENYQPLKTNFEDALADISSMVERGVDAKSIKESIANINVNGLVSVEDQGVKVSIDAEMLKMVENTTHYQSLLAAKKQFGSMLKMAIVGD